MLVLERGTDLETVFAFADWIRASGLGEVVTIHRPPDEMSAGDSPNDS
jgi:hypothetical protein